MTAPVRLALVGLGVIQAATATPLDDGWWSVASRSWYCEVQARDPRDLPRQVHEFLAPLGVGSVYGHRARATRLAHQQA